MRILIEIPEEVKQAFDRAESNDLRDSYYDLGGVIGMAIKNGTPLPLSESAYCRECPLTQILAILGEEES